VDDALKTRGNIYLIAETSLFFAPLYQNFWLRACSDRYEIYSMAIGHYCPTNRRNLGLLNWWPWKVRKRGAGMTVTYCWKTG